MTINEDDWRLTIDDNDYDDDDADADAGDAIDPLTDVYTASSPLDFLFPKFHALPTHPKYNKASVAYG